MRNDNPEYETHLAVVPIIGLFIVTIIFYYEIISQGLSLLCYMVFKCILYAIISWGFAIFVLYLYACAHLASAGLVCL